MAVANDRRNTKGGVLTLREAAKFLRVSTSTIYRLVESRTIPCFRLGSLWRFNLEELEVWTHHLSARPDGPADTEKRKKELSAARATRTRVGRRL